MAVLYDRSTIVMNNQFIIIDLMYSGKCSTKHLTKGNPTSPDSIIAILGRYFRTILPTGITNCFQLKSNAT